MLEQLLAAEETENQAENLVDTEVDGVQMASESGISTAVSARDDFAVALQPNLKAEELEVASAPLPKGVIAHTRQG